MNEAAKASRERDPFATECNGHWEASERKREAELMEGVFTLWRRYGGVLPVDAPKASSSTTRPLHFIAGGGLAMRGRAEA